MFKWFDEVLFNHVGRTLQKWAIIFLILEVISCIFWAIVAEDLYLSVFILLGGIGAVFLTSYPIYAFGQIVEDIHEMRNDMKKNTQTSPNRIDADELPDL